MTHWYRISCRFIISCLVWYLDFTYHTRLFKIIGFLEKKKHYWKLVVLKTGKSKLHKKYSKYKYIQDPSMFIQSTSLSSRISKNIFLIHLRNTFPNMNALFLPVDSYFHMYVFSREPVTIYICKIHVRRISGCPSMWSQRWYYLSKLV